MKELHPFFENQMLGSVEEPKVFDPELLSKIQIVNEDYIDPDIKDSFSKDLLDDIETILDNIEKPDEFSYDVAFMDLMTKQQQKL